MARNAIREDLLHFALPALVVFVLGLVLSARDGYDGLLAAIWNVVKQPQRFYLLSVPNIAGLILCLVGLTIAIVAVITLGRFYSSTLAIRGDHQLITHGVYRLARHPIYFGVILACFGAPVYASSLYGLIAMSALIPVFLNRIRIEERVLTEEFGDAYDAYKASTSKLIPFIY